LSKILNRIKNLPAILKILIPVIAGIIFSFKTSYDLKSVSLCFVVIILAVLLAFNSIKRLASVRLKFYLATLISVLFFFISVLSVEFNNSLNKTNYFYKKGAQYYQVRINEPPEVKSKSVKIIVDVISRNDTIVSGKALMYVKKDEHSIGLKYGDVLLMKSEFTESRSNGNPFEFNYPNYLKLFDIYHQGFLDSGKWLTISNSQNKLFKITYEISGYLSNVINESNLNAENKAIAKALLIGQKDDLSKEVLRTYSSAGAMHVLAVSGLHVGIVMLILMFILKPIKRFRSGKMIFLLTVLFGVWFYAFVTGLSPSVLRSSLMFSFIVVGKELERETSVYQSILVSALFLLIVDPLVLFKVGFQLSYLAVLGVVYIQPKIYRLFYIKYKPIDYLWQISSVSIAAQLATFPLGLYYFHQFPNFFLVSNLIVIPIAGIILVLGISYLVFNEIPYLNDFILNELNGVLSFMNSTVGWVKSLPFSITWGISIFWYEVVLIYGVLILFVFSFTLKKGKLLIMSFFTCIVVLGLLMFRSNATNKKNEIVVYNIKDDVAIDVFYGDKNLFLSSDSLVNNEDKLLFNIKHYWFYKTGKESPVYWRDIANFKNSILKLKTKTVSVCNQNSIAVMSDFIVVSDIQRIHDYTIKQWVLNKSVLIIHPSIKYYVKRKLLKEYPSQLIHDIKNEGAFIFSF